MLGIEEAREAARLIGDFTARLEPRDLATPLSPLPAGSQAFGPVEGWRGPILHWVLTGPGGNSCA